MRIQVIVENKVFRSGLIAEHGLSLLGEIGGKRFLFDLGQSQDVFLNNCRKLGVNIEDVDFVFLSHGHYDHTGSLALLPDLVSSHTVLYAHSLIRTGKYKKEGKRLRYVGLPDVDWDRLTDSCMVDLAFPCRRIDENLFLSGSIPDYGYPKMISPYYVLKDGEVDEFNDEVCLYCLVKEEVVILTGCSHRGILNIVSHAREKLSLPVRAIIGGFHLQGLPEEELERVVSELERLGVKELYPLHCTGVEEACWIKRRFSGKCEVKGCGDEIVFS